MNTCFVSLVDVITEIIASAKLSESKNYTVDLNLFYQSLAKH